MGFQLAAVITALGLSGGVVGAALLYPYFICNHAKSEKENTLRDMSYLGAEALIHNKREEEINKKELAHERERNPFTGTVSGCDKRTTWEIFTNTNPKEKSFTDKLLGRDHDIWGNRLVEKKKWYEPDDDSIFDWGKKKLW